MSMDAGDHQRLAELSARFEPFAATAQHLQLLKRKIDRLAEARAEAEDQLFTAIGREFRTGGLTDLELVGLFAAISPSFAPGYTQRWNASVPVTAGTLAARASFLARNPMNGPDRLSWVGEYPLSEVDVTPPKGISVVYVLYAADNEPIYVGSSGSLRTRLKAHSRQGKPFTAWMAYPCGDREEAYRLEDELLKGRLPPLNRKVGR